MKYSKFIFILYIAIAGNLFPQNNYDSEITMSVFVEGGYNNFQLDEISETYQAMLEPFTERNVPIKTQKLYPGNGVFGGGISFNTETVQIIIGLNYTQTQAYSLYGDYSGELDLKGDMQAYGYYIGLKQEIAKWGVVNPFVEANLNYTSSECTFSSEITITGAGPQKEQVKFSSTNLYFQPNLGVSYNLSSVNLYAKAGYKLLVIKDIKTSSNIPVEINLTGFAIMSGASIAF